MTLYLNYMVASPLIVLSLIVPTQHGYGTYSYLFSSQDNKVDKVAPPPVSPKHG